MYIIIFLIFATTSLTFTYALYSPINNWANFDISINQKHYQYKIDLYLNKKWGTNKIPNFTIHAIKELPAETASNTSEIVKTIKWNIKPILEHKIKKTYKYNGYLRFKDSGIYVHRWMMKKDIGRRLTSTEVVHHIDGNKLNNNIDNLMLFLSQAEHHAYHKECKKKYGTWYAILPNYNNYIKSPVYNI